MIDIPILSYLDWRTPKGRPFDLGIKKDPKSGPFPNYEQISSYFFISFFISAVQGLPSLVLPSLHSSLAASAGLAAVASA